MRRLSGEYEMRGDVWHSSCIAREAQLLSVGLTFSPASLGARPASFQAGDIREARDRRSWPTSWRYELEEVLGQERRRERVTLDEEGRYRIVASAFPADLLEALERF
jgi:hypothetical protein